MIAVIGSVNMDLVINLEEIPKVGETVCGGVFMTNPGGKGANQAVAAAKLGSEVCFIGCVGDDDFAPALKKNLKDAGVDISHLETLGKEKSGVAFIQVDKEGRNNIAVASGANFAITKEMIDKHISALEGADIAVFQIEIPMEINRYALKRAREAGCTVIFNPSPVTELTPEVFASTNIMIPNEHELARLTALPCDSLENIEAAARALQKRGVETVIVTLGEKGAMVLDGENCVLRPALRVKAVDTTAAGDAFLGGFAHCYEKTQDIMQAVDFGQRVAAFAVQRAGAQQSMPTAADIEEGCERA